MTATDEQHGQSDTGYPHTLRPELHKALIARGIDYWVIQGITFWNRDDGCECLAYGYQADGVPKLAIKVVGFTNAEQAVEATLGRGTCKNDSIKHDGVFACSACGVYLDIVNMESVQKDMDIDDLSYEPRYCPSCGRRVVE